MDAPKDIFKKYQAQTFPSPSCLEIESAKGSYITDIPILLSYFAYKFPIQLELHIINYDLSNVLKQFLLDLDF